MKKRTSPYLFTLGYEGATVDVFIDRLRQAGVTTVIDVRELPLSRKAGFSKRSFSDHLALAGLHYFHAPALGCPREIRNQYRVDGDWSAYRKGFKRYLVKQTVALDQLALKADDGLVCLVCFEADYRFCHRTIVADAVAASGRLTVQHLRIQTDFVEPAPGG
jgi:uncharacterized protein (DUF488 family)